MKKPVFTRSFGAVLLAALFFLSSCSKSGADASTEPSSDSSVSSADTSTSSVSDPEVTSVSSGSPSSSSDSGSDPETQTSYFDPDGETLVPADGDVAEELSKLPGVTHVYKRKAFTQDQYLLYYEMPIDHNDPGKGTFTQRLYVYYKGKDAPNMFNVGGYNLYYGMYDGDLYNEAESVFSQKYNCNFFEPEYRFDGASIPEGFLNTEADNWEYLTSEQASEDFHAMINSLKTIFHRNWCMEGSSKGGVFTTYYLSSHPEDIDLFIAECAMVKMDRNYPGSTDYVYTTAGDDHYGKEQAKKYRDLLLRFQVEMIKHRDILQDEYWTRATKYYEQEFASSFTKEILFDCTVLDMRFIFQYDNVDFAGGNFFERMEEVLSYADEPSQKQRFINLSCDLLEDIYGPWHYSFDAVAGDPDAMNIYAFFFQNYHEDGNLDYDFSYLRKALKKDGNGASLYITEEMEPDVFSYRITDWHKDMSYSPDALNARLAAIENTEKPLILVNGLSDIYQVAEIKECDNPNVHIFNLPKSFHDEVSLDFLSDEQFKEYDAIVREALEI